jgi:integrase
VASIRIRQRKDGTAYTSVLYVHQGKQTSTSFNDHSEALRFQDVCTRLGPAEARRIWRAAAPSDGHTVKSFIAEHIEAMSGVEKKTVAEYQRYLSRDIDPVLGHIPLSTLSRTDISKWVNKLRADGASGKTISNKVGFLSGCLNMAVKAGEIPANPAAGVRLPRTVAREMTFLSRDEFQLLKVSFTERWHPFLDFLVASGCRFSEATALTPTDIDAVNGTVRISKGWKRTPSGYEIGQPKTQRSVRTINVPASVLAELDFSHEWLFTNSQGGPIRLYSWRTNVWLPSLARARTEDSKKPDTALLEKRPRIHDLRHTNASWLIHAGVPLPVIQRHLGHESIQTTVDRYGHLERNTSRVVADVIGKALKPNNASVNA